MYTEAIEGFRLSPQQKRLWQFYQGSPAYKAQIALLVEGNLDVTALREAVTQVISKHEILRTVFHQAPEIREPVQIITGCSSPIWCEIDLAERSRAERDTEIERLLRQERCASFDLAGGPILRVCLILLAPSEHLLILSLPSLYADGHALKNLAQEISRCYGEIILGEESETEPAQYADLSEWQHELLEGKSGEAGREYWRKQGISGTAMFRLRSERNPDESDQFDADLVVSAINPEVVRAIESVAREYSITVSAFLLACWQTLLWRLTGGSEVVIGNCCDGRKYEELQTALGLFARVVPIRRCFESDYRFDEVSRQAHQSISDACEWQEYFIWNQDDAQAFFPNCFEIEVRDAQFGGGGVVFSQFKQYVCAEQFELKICCVRRGQSLEAEYHYDRRLFTANEVEQIGRSFEELVRNAASDPQSRVSDLSILCESDRHRMLVAFNRTESDYPKQKSVQRLFEEQVARTPDKIAAVSGRERYSYSELNAKSNRLARYLRGLGVGPETRVGIYLERSPAMVVAILGVLKSDGAYVPLGPAYPSERLAFMLEDAAVAVVLTSEKLAESLPANSVEVVCLDSDWELIERESDANATSNVTSENLAYVIYTSGSTGQPKGVMIEQRGLVNYLSWALKAYDVANGQGAPVHSPLAFDLTVTSLFLPLLAGKPVELVREEEGIDGLISALRDSRSFSVLKLTPAHLELVGEQLSAEQLAGSARALVVGGETLLGESLRAWRESGPQTWVVNEYGPTETVVGCCVYAVRAGQVKSGPVPIGRPIANTQLYVLDARLRPIPAGASGELYIGGEGVSRGYHNRPDLTADRFIPNPFSDEPGARMYRTGDRTRHLLDGNLEFLGRTDDQVKIRGYRVELGEIEIVLRQHPEIREAVAVIREDKPGDKRLVAYIVPERKRQISIGELRSAMEQKLPEFMIPSAFVALDALPLTSNGKVDRRALPGLDGARPDTQQAYAPPCTLAEEVLAEIWAEVLGLDRVGIDDNFFAMGGDSIRSIQVRSRARERELAISHQQVFQHQTIRELAREAAFGELGPLTTTPTYPFSLISPQDRSKLLDGVEDAYPISLLQAGMIFHSEFSTAAPIFHDQHSFHLRAPLNTEKLRESIRELMGRHAALRTSFDLSRFSEPLQLVHKTPDVALLENDLRHLTGQQQEEAISEWLEAERRHPFDWSKTPLLRCYIHRRGEESFQFTMSFHHAIMDGWSAASLFTELFRRYVSKMSGDERVIEPLAVSYRDFIALERAALGSDETRRFWRRQLSDSVITRMPRWSPAFQNGNAGSQIEFVDVPVPVEVSEALKQLARGKSVPLKSVLLAAHLRVMSLLSGQSDVLSGLVSNGRPEENDGEKVVGLFLNALPFRVNLTGGTWAELVEQVFEAERSMLPFRRYPMAQLQREQGGPSLFETAFNFMHYHVYRGLEQLQEFADIKVLGWAGFEQTNFTLLANFSLDLGTANVQLNLALDKTQLCDEQIDAIKGYYGSALSAMANDSSSRYETTCLMSDPERFRLLYEWNNREADYSGNECLHTLFEEQAGRTPDAIAVSYEERHVTYGELNRRANQVAHYLRSVGVGRESVVGLCLNRSIEMMVAILGVLKAGAAYLPLEGAYPPERLSYMLEDAGAGLLITEQGLDQIVRGLDVEEVLIDSDWGRIAQFSESNLRTENETQGIAYVIYTSGSTGRPKGVMVSHSNVVRLFRATEHRFKFDERDVWSMFHSYAFDFSVWEIWGALLKGGRLVVVPYWVSRTPEAFYQLVSKEGVTVLNQTPSAFREYIRVEEERGGEEQKLRLVIFGGEALELRSLRGWVARHGDDKPALVNMYGITETTVHVTYRAIKRGDVERGDGGAIGEPIDDLQVYLLDGHLNVVPVGVAGEICVGGAGLARGYLGRADLSAERFVPDEYGEKEGGRLYRSGDLARRLATGDIEYIGRRDQQVKIRGFRIELGEIESALSTHARVSEAVVVARDEVGEGKQLVAYYVASEGAGAEADELREYLRERLPEYMVPHRYVRQEKMPLTENGKIDRKGLPPPQGVDSRARGASLAPRTPVEDLLGEIWGQLLEVDSVGIDDSFFDLGGHSLLATRLITRVRDAFRVDLPLRTLFDRPTVALMAESIQAVMQSEHYFQAPPLVPVSRGKPLPVSFAEQRLWFLDQLEPGRSFSNVPAGVRLLGRLDSDALNRSIDEVINRHENLRTTFQAIGGRPARVVSPAKSLSIPVVNLADLSEPEREARAASIAAREASLPFDLAQGPLVRITLLRMGAEDHVMLLVMHHIISDGWSIGVLINEMAAIYKAISSGEPFGLPDLPIQYADFAFWQQERFSAEALEAELSYWKSKLASAPASLEFPTDRPRPAIPSYRGATQSFLLPAAFGKDLKAVCRSEGVTLFMVLLAGFQTLLHRYTGQDDISVGSPVAGRDRPETEVLIGCFVNTLVMRTDLTGNPRLRELLGRVRETALGAYTHQEVPFEKIVEELRPQRNSGPSPLFQVWFVLHNTPMPAVELPDLSLIPLEVDGGTATFDLTLSMAETADGLSGAVTYSTDLFDPGTIADMIARFEIILREIATHPNKRLLDIPLWPSPAAVIPSLADAEPQFVF